MDSKSRVANQEEGKTLSKRYNGENLSAFFPKHVFRKVFARQSVAGPEPQGRNLRVELGMQGPLFHKGTGGKTINICNCCFRNLQRFVDSSQEQVREEI